MPTARRFPAYALALLAGTAAIGAVLWMRDASHARRGDAPPADAAAAPPLAFDPPRIELGDILPGQKVVRPVRIRNLTEAPVTIERAAADCSCTRPGWPKDAIPAHGELESEVTYEAGTKQGLAIDKRITYLLRDGRVAFLPVTGHVGEFIRFPTDTVEAPAAPSAGAVSAPIVLESADGTAFRVTAVDPPVILDAPAAPGLRAELHVDWAAWLGAGRPIKLTVTTDHPKAPPFMVVVKRPIGAPAPTAPVPAAPEAPDPDAMPTP